MPTETIRATKEDEALVLKYFNNVRRREFDGKGEGLEVSSTLNGIVFFPPGTAHHLFWSYWHSEDGNASLTRTPPKLKGVGSSLSHCIAFVKSHIQEMLDLAATLNSE